MGKIWMPGGGGGADLDVITAEAGDGWKSDCECGRGSDHGNYAGLERNPAAY